VEEHGLRKEPLFVFKRKRALKLTKNALFDKENRGKVVFGGIIGA